MGYGERAHRAHRLRLFHRGECGCAEVCLSTIDSHGLSSSIPLHRGSIPEPFFGPMGPREETLADRLSGRLAFGIQDASGKKATRIIRMLFFLRSTHLPTDK